MTGRTFLVLAALLAVFSTGCTNFYTTRIELTDGTVVQGVPRCTNGSGGDRAVYGNGIEDGIRVADIQRRRSPAGLEPVIIGSLAMAGGIALIAWGLSDQRVATEWRGAVGGVVGGLGLIQIIAGLMFLIPSTSALNRTCSSRSPWFRP